jgi:hypothetical protein
MGSPFELSGLGVVGNLCTALRDDLLFAGQNCNSVFHAIDPFKEKNKWTLAARGPPGAQCALFRLMVTGILGSNLYRGIF